jgi:hypothetical protein
MEIKFDTPEMLLEIASTKQQSSWCSAVVSTFRCGGVCTTIQNDYKSSSAGPKRPWFEPRHQQTCFFYELLFRLFRWPVLFVGSEVRGSCRSFSFIALRRFCYTTQVRDCIWSSLQSGIQPGLILISSRRRREGSSHDGSEGCRHGTFPEVAYIAQLQSPFSEPQLPSNEDGHTMTGFRLAQQRPACASPSAPSDQYVDNSIW